MRLAYVIIGCWVLCGCTQRSNIDVRLAEAGQHIDSAPDSALAIIEDIVADRASGINDEQRSAVSILSAKAKLRQGKSFLTDENFDKALLYLESAGDTGALLDIYQLAAIKMRWEGKQDSAACFLKKAIVIATPFSEPSKSDLYIELSNLYARPSLKKDYHAAIIYARQALESAGSHEEKARAMHDMGLFYSFCDDNDSAATYIEQALELTDPESRHYTTYALNYANTPKADFRRSVDYLGNIKNESLGKYITLGFLYLNNSKLDSALHYAKIAGCMYEDAPSRYSINTYNNLRLLKMSVEMRSTGRVIPDDGTVTNDSISELMSIQRKISEERREHNNMLRLRLLEAKTRRQLIWNIALGALVLLVTGSGVTLWYARRRYMRLKRQLDDVRVRQIVSEANADGGGSQAVTDMIRQRLGICIEQYRISKLQSEIDAMEMQYRTTGNYPSTKARESVQKGLIASFADFIVDLKMTGAKLNLDDIVTCIMACLKYSNAAMAACLGSTDTAVRTRKSRLRAKLPPHISKLLSL